MRRRTSCAALVASTIAFALAAPAIATAKTKTVTAGLPSFAKSLHLLSNTFKQKYSPDVNDFFLHRVTINQGDTISFAINGFHTVDLPGASGKDLPLVIAGSTVSGVNDAAGNPFWFNGKVPSLGLNPALFAKIGGSSYNGSSRIDSGIFLGNGNPPPLKVKFTKAGTYKYFCDVHPGMIGYVVVRPAGKSVPSAAQDKRAITKQLKADAAALKAAAKVKPPANQVSLGSSGPNGVEDYAMFPTKLSVPVGSVVTFAMSKDTREVHTAAFGPTPYVMAAANSLASPSPDQYGWYPSDPGTITLAGSSTHGNGFVNTGVLDRDPTTPQPATDKIKFTKAGTYTFICLIHPFMQGTIVVH